MANKSLIPYNLIKRAPYFFWVENCYLLTWNLAHILCNLKAFTEAIKTFWMWRHWSHHISAFSAGNLPLTVLVRLQTLVVFFVYFSAFCEFQCHFYQNTFVLTFIMKYLLYFGIKGVEIHKIWKMVFFYSPPTNLQYKIIHSWNYS